MIEKGNMPQVAPVKDSPLDCDCSSMLCLPLLECISNDSDQAEEPSKSPKAKGPQHLRMAQPPSSLSPSSWPILQTDTFNSLTAVIENWSNSMSKENTDEDASAQRSDPSSGTGETTDYAALHDTLLNCLFEDSRQRYSLLKEAKDNADADSSAHSRGGGSPLRMQSLKNFRESFHKVSPARKTANKTMHSNNKNNNHSKSIEVIEKNKEVEKVSLNKNKNKNKKKGIKIRLPARMKVKKKKRSKSDVTEASTECSQAGLANVETIHTVITSKNPVKSRAQSHKAKKTPSVNISAKSLIHLNCRLQKDKGKGEKPGTLISAYGRMNTMKKLREKMDVIAEVESGDVWSSAVITRVPAIVVQGDHAKEENHKQSHIVETRSMLEVKMGFVSMKYGVLFHWNKDHGRVELILLRKMCTESFMKIGTNSRRSAFVKGSDKAHKSLSDIAVQKASKRKKHKKSAEVSESKQEQQGPYADEGASLEGTSVEQEHSASHNSYFGYNPNSSKNVGFCQKLLDHMPKTKALNPTVLEITVLRARGLQGGGPRSADRLMNPYVKLSIADEEHKTAALKCTNNPNWSKKLNNHCKLKCASTGAPDDDHHLKVMLFDWRPFKSDKLLGLVYVPLSLVEAQPKDGIIPPLEVTLPCKMLCSRDGPQGTKPFGSLTLSLICRDESSCSKGALPKEKREKSQ